MGRRWHDERYPRWSPKSVHGQTPKWLKERWNRDDRRDVKQRLSQVDDPDAMILTPANRIGDIYEWI